MRDKISTGRLRMAHVFMKHQRLIKCLQHSRG